MKLAAVVIFLVLLGFFVGVTKPKELSVLIASSILLLLLVLGWTLEAVAF